MNAKANLSPKKKNNATGNKNKIIRGNGWTIVRDSYDAVTIKVANPACLASNSYQNAVKMLADTTKNIRIILTYVN